jgi:hypothetical protein
MGQIQAKSGLNQNEIRRIWCIYVTVPQNVSIDGTATTHVHLASRLRVSTCSRANIVAMFQGTAITIKLSSGVPDEKS